MKAYTLLSALMCSLSVKQLICQKLIEDKNFNYAALMEKDPDDTSNLLEELEIVTIEYFYELRNSIFEYRKIIK